MVESAMIINTSREWLFSRYGKLSPILADVRKEYDIKGIRIKNNVAIIVVRTFIRGSRIRLTV